MNSANDRVAQAWRAVGESLAPIADALTAAASVTARAAARLLAALAKAPSTLLALALCDRDGERPSFDEIVAAAALFVAAVTLLNIFDIRPLD